MTRRAIALIALAAALLIAGCSGAGAVSNPTSSAPTQVAAVRVAQATPTAGKHHPRKHRHHGHHHHKRRHHHKRHHTVHYAWGCAAAIRYLSKHANPQYQIECPGDAVNPDHSPAQAETCTDTPGFCTAPVIKIRIPCPTAYRNEAANSWIMWNLLLTGKPLDWRAKIDPYGPSC